MTLSRLLPLSGLVFVALMVIAFVPLGGGTPGIDASQSKIVDYYAAHHGAQTAAVYVLAIAVGFLVLFAASLWSRLGRSDVVSLWQIVFIAGAAVAVAGFLLAATLHFALSDGVHAGVSPDAAQALNALDARDYLGFSSGIGIMLVGAAGMMIPLRGSVRVLGWAALVTGIGLFTPVGFFAFLLAGIWIIAASITLAVSIPGSSPAVQPVPA